MRVRGGGWGVEVGEWGVRQLFCVSGFSILFNVLVVTVT